MRRWLYSLLVGAALLGACSVDASVNPGTRCEPSGACPDGTSCYRGFCVANLLNLCNSVEVDTLTNEEHCGGCNSPCLEAQQCCNGQCIDVANDAVHCGACNNPCDESALCCDGQCVPSDGDNCGVCGNACVALSCCDGQCVDTASDANYCGSCGAGPCAAGETCSEGHCCSEGLTWCVSAAQCIDTATDINHCGVCDNFCGTGGGCRCEAGTCKGGCQ